MLQPIGLITIATILCAKFCEGITEYKVIYRTPTFNAKVKNQHSGKQKKNIEPK